MHKIKIYIFLEKRSKEVREAYLFKSYVLLEIFQLAFEPPLPLVLGRYIAKFW